MDWEKWRSQWTRGAPDGLKNSYLEDIEHSLWKMNSWWLEIRVFNFLTLDEDDQVSRNDYQSSD